jgi:hypothetical protein
MYPRRRCPPRIRLGGIGWLTSRRRCPSRTLRLSRRRGPLRTAFPFRPPSPTGRLRPARTRRLGSSRRHARIRRGRPCRCCRSRARRGLRRFRASRRPRWARVRIRRPSPAIRLIGGASRDHAPCYVRLIRAQDPSPASRRLRWMRLARRAAPRSGRWTWRGPRWCRRACRGWWARSCLVGPGRSRAWVRRSPAPGWSRLAVGDYRRFWAVRCRSWTPGSTWPGRPWRPCRGRLRAVDLSVRSLSPSRA